MSTALAETGRRWLSDWGNLLALGVSVYAAVYLLWLSFPLGSQELHDLVVQLAFLPLLFPAVVLAWRHGKDRSLSPEIRRAWWVLGLGFLLYWSGDLIWAYYDLTGDGPPPISWADAAYLASFPLLFWGLLHFRSATRSVPTRLFWIDASTILIGAATLSWYWLIGPLAREAHANGWTEVFTVVYPLTDLFLLVAVVVVVLCHPPAESKYPLRLLALGVLLFVVADLGWGLLELHDAYDSGNWPDAIWMLGSICLVWSPQAQRWKIRTGAVGWLRPGLVARLTTALPYVALVSGYGMLLTVGLAAGSYRLDSLFFGIAAVTGLLVLRQVVTHRQNLRLVAWRHEARFTSFVQNASDLISLIDSDTTIAFQTPSVARLLGYAPQDMVGRRLIELIHLDDRSSLFATLASLRDRPSSLPVVTARWLRRDGSWCITETIVSDLRDDPAVGGIVLNTRDVTERKRLEDQLTHQAFHDALTGLPNRALFMNRLTQALAGASRTAQPVAVLFLDLDNFKVINDSLGHHDGDQLLIAVAQRLRQVMRDGDTIARLGGDEFTVLLQDVDSVGIVTEVAERIIESLRQPLYLSGRELIVSTSIGIALSGPHHQDASALLRAADVALYQAKHLGRSRYALFESHLTAQAMERLEIEQDLRRALQRDELVIFYQPIVELATEQVVEVEALVRWRHPSRGLLAPSQFISVAEESGLIVVIGQRILAEACRQVRAWQLHQPGMADVKLSVNLAARQFRHPLLVDEILGVLAATEFDPGSLRLEITEADVLNEMATAEAMLAKLRDAGIELVIDDFGTGYSSLAYLKRFPINGLKIDRAFIAGLGRESEEGALVRAAIAAAQALRLQVTAEGVETIGQIAELLALGCQRAQGFYFAEPRSAEEMESIIAHRIGASSATP